MDRQAKNTMLKTVYIQCTIYCVLVVLSAGLLTVSAILVNTDCYIQHCKWTIKTDIGFAIIPGIILAFAILSLVVILVLIDQIKCSRNLRWPFKAKVIFPIRCLHLLFVGLSTTQLGLTGASYHHNCEKRHADVCSYWSWNGLLELAISFSITSLILLIIDMLLSEYLFSGSFLPNDNLRILRDNKKSPTDEILEIDIPKKKRKNKQNKRKYENNGHNASGRSDFYDNEGYENENWSHRTSNYITPSNEQRLPPQPVYKEALPQRRSNYYRSNDGYGSRMPCPNHPDVDRASKTSMNERFSNRNPRNPSYDNDDIDESHLPNLGFVNNRFGPKYQNKSSYHQRTPEGMIPRPHTIQKY